MKVENRVCKKKETARYEIFEAIFECDGIDAPSITGLRLYVDIANTSLISVFVFVTSFFVWIELGIENIFFKLPRILTSSVRKRIFTLTHLASADCPDLGRPLFYTFCRVMIFQLFFSCVCWCCLVFTRRKRLCTSLSFELVFFGSNKLM